MCQPVDDLMGRVRDIEVSIIRSQPRAAESNTVAMKILRPPSSQPSKGPRAMQRSIRVAAETLQDSPAGSGILDYPHLTRGSRTHKIVTSLIRKHRLSRPRYKRKPGRR